MSKDEQWLLDEKYDGIVTDDYNNDAQRLDGGEPLAYVIGYQPFLGLKIYLDSKPLIPRPETEWWVEKLMLEIFGTLRSSMERAGGTVSAENDSVPKNLKHNLKFLDLCAGSGAIGCAVLSRLLNAQVYFGEIDPSHKETILKNIRENKLDASRADVRVGDLFEPFAGLTFDVIAANPPYIRTDRELPKSVKDFEPSLALFSKDNGLSHIARIAEQLFMYLKPEGVLWIECDADHADEAAQLFRDKGFIALIRTDQFEKKRFLVVHPIR